MLIERLAARVGEKKRNGDEQKPNDDFCRYTAHIPEGMAVALHTPR
jgi:hypothetical protein